MVGGGVEVVGGKDVVVGVGMFEEVVDEGKEVLEVVWGYGVEWEWGWVVGVGEEVCKESVDEVSVGVKREEVGGVVGVGGWWVGCGVCGEWGEEGDVGGVVVRE